MSSDALLCGSTPGERLPCVPVDELLAQVTDEQPPHDPAHQKGCASCRVALAELRDIWAPVHDLAAEDVSAPAGLLDAVMARVQELSRNPWYAFVPGPNGHTRIAARVVGAIARLAAQSVPSVALALGQGHAASSIDATAIAGPSDEAATDIGVAGAYVVVDVQIAVEFGAPIHDVARQVRQQISRDLQRHAGLMTAEVHVVVVDVMDPESADRT